MCQSLIPPDGKGPDLSRIESAYRAIRIKLYTSKARNELEHYYDYLQLRVHDLFTLAPYRPTEDRTEMYKKEVEAKIESVMRVLDNAIIDADKRMKNLGVRSTGIDHMVPLVLDVQSFTRYSRLYLELLEKYDQITLRLQIMYSRELISEEDMEREQAQPRKAMRQLCGRIHQIFQQEFKQSQEEK